MRKRKRETHARTKRGGEKRISDNGEKGQEKNEAGIMTEGIKKNKKVE